MNLKQGDKSISCNNASGNFIGVISGDKKSLKFLPINYQKYHKCKRVEV